MSLSPGSTLGPYAILAELGHGGMGVVYTAQDPRLKRQVAIKLLTDVVMPGMNGSDLAAIIEARRPDAKILFMSGYAGDLVKKVMRRGGGLLEKPFSAATLLQRIRRVLDDDPVRDVDATA